MWEVAACNAYGEGKRFIFFEQIAKTRYTLHTSFFFFLYINHTKYKAKVRQLGLFINKFR